MLNGTKPFFIYFLLAISSNHLSWGQSLKTDSCADFSLNIIKEGGNIDSIRLLYYDCFERGGDTILLVNGLAKIDGKVNRATEAVLFTDIHNRTLDGPRVIRFLIEPRQMSLSFSLVNDTVQDIKITGSKSQAEKERWELANAALLDQHYFNSLVEQYRKFKDDNNPGMQKVYWGKIDSLYEKRAAAAIAYIKANPNSYFGGYLLWKYKSRISIDSVQVYYTSLADCVKQSQLGKAIWSDMFRRTSDMDFRRKNSDPIFFSQLEKIKSLHDISLIDTTGQIHHLSKLKGKYVVVDFWGSWCGPCFQNIPYLKNLIAEMKGRQVEFISISIDTYVARWKKAIAEHHFPGLNLVDTTGLIAAFFKVPSVPKYVIINPDGTIANEDAPQPISGELKPLLLSVINRKDRAR